jgi:hypothetical protein
LPCFSYFLCLCIGICTLEAKTLVGILITCILSVEVLSVFWQDSVVARLRCYFLSLAWGYGSEAKHLPMCSGYKA